MKSRVPDILEQGRITEGYFSSSAADGFTGAFLIFSNCGRTIKIISSTGLGWEHVSVSLQKHCPNWQEMCFVKDLFWDAEEVVMQLHPAKSQYVNNHPNCLHLWRPTDQIIPTPPAELVGVKNLSPEEIEALSREAKLALINKSQQILTQHI